MGTKKADNLILRLETKSRILNYTIKPGEIKAKDHGSNALVLKQGELNPTQQIILSLVCQGNPAEDQVEKFELTHSEGVAVNKKSAAFTKIRFSMLYSEFEFNLLNSKLRLVRFGPWSCE